MAVKYAGVLNVEWKQVEKNGVNILGEIIDIYKLRHEWMHCWNIWVAPLYKDKMWYTDDWYNETMEAFANTEKAMSGISVVFMVMPPPEVINPDHK